MPEIVKVFKNVNTQTPTSNTAPYDVTLLTTASDETVVIKDVVTKGFIEGESPQSTDLVTLDLDGFPVTGGTNLEVGGNLIMNPSSTLKLKVGERVGPYTFEGMFFSENQGQEYLTGNGSDTNSIIPTNLSVSTHPSSDACAAMVGGVVFFYRLYSSTIYKYNAAGTLVTSWTHGSTGYGMCTDGTYIYRTSGSGASTTIYRTKLSDHTTSTLTTTSSYYAVHNNMGSYFLYHNGKLYSKEDANAGYVSIIDLSDMSVIIKSHADFAIGNYSDGAAITTTAAGTTYLVEVAQGGWTYWNLDIDDSTTTPVGLVKNGTQGSSSSTEYAQGGGEVAPGIVLVFGEESDRVTIIDMNQKSYFTDPNVHGYTTGYSYGNRFAFAALLYNIDPSTYTYDAYVSGVSITP